MPDTTEFEWDAFISHASEDKQSFVLPLVQELQKYNLRIWFDAFALKVGDSLRESIDRGLAKSRFGIVVLSHSFFAKKWPQKELNALFARDVILPVWLNLTEEDMLRYSPMVSDLVACKAAAGIPAVARRLVEVIRPEAFELQTSLADAQRAAERLRHQLKEANPNPHLEYRISAGASAIDPVPQPGLVGSAAKDGFRIDIFTRNTEAYNQTPMSFKVQLTRDAWKRIEEAQRTGDKILLGPDEFRGVSSEVFTSFGFPPELFTGFRSLLIDPSGHLRKRKFRMRVRFEQGNDFEEFPFIEFEVVRAGKEQIEIRSFAPPLPFCLTITLRFDDAPNGIDATFSYTGHEIRKIFKADRAMRLLMNGGRLDLFDLESDEKFVGLGGAQSTTIPDEADRFMEQFIAHLHEVALACKESVDWSHAPTEEDTVHLACLHQVIATGKIDLPANDVTITRTSHEYQTIQPVLEHKGGLIFQQAEPAFFATVFGKTFDIGPYRIFIKVGDYRAAAPDNADLRIIHITPAQPLIFEFARFIKAEHAL